jgi:hypothetical protein
MYYAWERKEIVRNFVSEICREENTLDTYA